MCLQTSNETVDADATIKRRHMFQHSRNAVSAHAEVRVVDHSPAYKIECYSFASQGFNMTTLLLQVYLIFTQFFSETVSPVIIVTLVVIHTEIKPK